MIISMQFNFPMLKLPPKRMEFTRIHQMFGKQSSAAKHLDGGTFRVQQNKRSIVIY